MKIEQYKVLCLQPQQQKTLIFEKRFPVKYHKQATVIGYLHSRQAEFTLKEIQVTQPKSGTSSYLTGEHLQNVGVVNALQTPTYGAYFM